MARSSAAFPTPSRPKRSPEAAPRTSVTCLRIADLPTWSVRQLEAGVIPEPLVVAEGALVAGVDAAAHRAGVRIGERVGRVSALCAEARILERDLTVERVAWDWALERVFDSTPFLESPRPGLMFLRGALPDEVAALAWELGAYSATADSHGTAALAALTAKAGQVVTVNSVNAFLANAPLGYTKHLGVEPEGNGLTDRHFPNGKFQGVKSRTIPAKTRPSSKTSAVSGSLHTRSSSSRTRYNSPGIDT